jgi:hypothetical protein
LPGPIADHPLLRLVRDVFAHAHRSVREPFGEDVIPVILAAEAEVGQFIEHFQRMGQIPAQLFEVVGIEFPAREKPEELRVLVHGLGEQRAGAQFDARQRLLHHPIGQILHAAPREMGGHGREQRHGSRQQQEQHDFLEESGKVYVLRVCPIIGIRQPSVPETPPHRKEELIKGKANRTRQVASSCVSPSEWSSNLV